MIPLHIAQQLADALRRALTAQCRIHGSAGREYWKDEFAVLAAFDAATPPRLTVTLPEPSEWGNDGTDCIPYAETVAMLKQQGIEVKP